MRCVDRLLCGLTVGGVRLLHFVFGSAETTRCKSVEMGVNMTEKTLCLVEYAISGNGLSEWDVWWCVCVRLCTEEH